MVIDAAAFLLFLGHAILLQNADCLPAPLCVALILCAAALPLLVCPEAHSQVVLVVIDGALWSWLSTHTHTHMCMREKPGTDTGMGLFRKTAFQMSPFSLPFIFSV